MGYISVCYFFFFFFQAEDGIRDYKVTGVQTCALPISLSFFWTAATDEPLGGIILSGGTARMPGLAAQLTKRLGCAVEVANPFRRLQVDRGVDRGLIEASGHALAVTVWVATRRPGGK